MGAGRSRRQIARNFVRRYGRERLRELLDALAAGESGQAIAASFSVSRERVRQWKNTFGTVVTLYQVHPDVARLLDAEAGADEADEPDAEPAAPPGDEPLDLDFDL